MVDPLSALLMIRSWLELSSFSASFSFLVRLCVGVGDCVRLVMSLLMISKASSRALGPRFCVVR